MIKIYPDKIIEQCNYDDKKIKEIKNDNLILYLGDNVELHDVTFGHFLNLFQKQSHLLEIFFSFELGHFPIKLFYDDLNKETDCIKENEHIDDIDYIELRMIIENNIFEDESILDIYPDFSGIFKANKKDELGNDIGGSNCSIEFEPLYSLKDFKLKLNTDVIIIGYNLNEINHAEILKSKIQWKLKDVLQGILYEISFMGTPENRNASKCNLLNDVEEIKKEIENQKS